MELVSVPTILVSALFLCGFATAYRSAWIVEKDYCTSQTGTDGICLDITDCKIFYDYVRENSFTNKVKQTILKYRCGRPSSQKVCCPYKVPPELERPKTLDFTKHANYNLLPTRCGITQTNKITNGNETNLFDYPWAVAIKYNIRELPWGCGGSLISDRYVLTAAHCIRNNNTITTVRLGEHDFNQDPDCEVNDEGQRRCAQKVQDFAYTKGDAIVHPSYNEKTNENDIALIRLPKPAILAINGALPICIPTKKAEITKTFTDYIVIGWGRTHNDFKSSVLLQANVPKVEIPDCAPNFVPDRILTDNQMCAGGKNEQDSCNGDSGGPLMADYVSDGELRTMQYGIVSVGAAACGTSGFPTVYTRVDKYVGWILDNMRP